MPTPEDDVMTGVAGRVQDARASGTPLAGGASLVPALTDHEALNRLRSFVHVSPLTAMLGAAAVGLGVGIALGRRGRQGS